MNRYRLRWQYTTQPPRWILIAGEWRALVAQTPGVDAHWSTRVERRKELREGYDGPTFTDSAIARRWCEAKIGELQI
jgi:hypothetical protein